MLEKLLIQNFRCFENHEIPFHKETTIVGRNNAGKSTTVEVLRLVSLVTNRHRNLTPVRVPREAKVPLYWALSPSTKNLDLDFNRAAYGLGALPSVLEARFSETKEVKVFVGADQKIYADIQEGGRSLVSGPNRVSGGVITPIHILPQVAPLQQSERERDPDYVRQNVTSNLSSLHFRNQLHLMKPEFKRFCQLVEESWQGLRVNDLIISDDDEFNHSFHLLMTDGDFVAEAAWMGHGVQIWLQTLWFVARTPPDAIVVLDEPDVYLHPDLQHKLIRLVRPLFPQVIIATHSVEIMESTSPEDILVIEREARSSEFAGTQPAVQRLIDRIGGRYNINLARLGRARRFIAVEGDDLSILSGFHAGMFPGADSLTLVPNVPIGGWGGWQHATSSPLILRNAIGQELTVYCVLDSDYHLPQQLEDRKVDAKAKKVELHIWNRKEIENYLLVPEVIARFVSARARKSKRTLSAGDVAAKIDHIAEELRQTVVDGYGDELLRLNSRQAHSTVSRQARQMVDDMWKSRSERWWRVPGKQALHKLTAWTQAEFGVSFGVQALVKEFRVDEIPGEVRHLLTAIESCKPLR